MNNVFMWNLRGQDVWASLWFDGPGVNELWR